jgi:transposase
MPDNHYSERERLVVDVYKNQNKSIREIAKTAKMSFRDIGYILKKEGLSHGIVTVEKNNKSSNNNEKATEAYRLFSEGKKPVQVAIQLGLSERQATRYYTEYWRLKRLYKLHSIYKELKGNLSPILKLYRLLRRQGIITDNIDWFVHNVNIGIYKIPDIQKQYAKIKDEPEDIDYKRTMAKYELQNITNQIAILNRDIYKKRNEIAYLKIGAQELEGYVHGLENHNQQQQQEIQNE